MIERVIVEALRQPRSHYDEQRFAWKSISFEIRSAQESSYVCTVGRHEEGDNLSKCGGSARKFRGAMPKPQCLLHLAVQTRILLDDRELFSLSRHQAEVRTESGQRWRLSARRYRPRLSRQPETHKQMQLRWLGATPIRQARPDHFPDMGYIAEALRCSARVL